MAVRDKANCIGNRVGAILIRDGRVISTGYNAVPEGMKSCTEGGCLRCSRAEEFPTGSGYDLCICTHAESNCILAAARFGIAVMDTVVYTTMAPCFTCSRELLNTQVKRVVYLHQWQPNDADPKLAKMKQEEYQKLISHFNEFKCIDIIDPKEKWAVRSKRDK